MKNTDLMKKRNDLINYLKEKYNIYSEKELERSLKELKPINIGILTKQ